MVDRELCGSNRHLVVKAEPLDGPIHAVSWWSALKCSLAGIGFMAAFSAFLIVVAGVTPGVFVITLSLALLVVCSACFLVAGHNFSCAVKKSLVTVFDWWQSI
ncbi:hypothetical protein ACFVVU_16880 [Kitasatospora sp. NPDC057965]|uniref:hypothetical protein n=1 Tax=Kitasatospora sp. NPDC057965 TaxID=3346291 RepID=UPI0036D807FF